MDEENTQPARSPAERWSMEWFDLGVGNSDEAGGVLELPESMTAPGLALELHIAVGAGDRTIAYWMLDTGVLVAQVDPGVA